MLQQFSLSTMAVTAGACFDVDGGNRRLSRYAGLRVTPAELPFDGRSQVLQQMKAVRYLPSLRRTPSHTLCIEPAPARLTSPTSGCCSSHRAVVSAERSPHTSTVSRRSRSTTIVP
jgi:hypothetical protein